VNGSQPVGLVEIVSYLFPLPHRQVVKKCQVRFDSIVGAVWLGLNSEKPALSHPTVSHVFFATA
jgi:hypothetical protein